MKFVQLYVSLLLALVLCASCNEAQYMQGKRTYDMVCADCHMEDGSGVVNLYPALRPLNSTLLPSDLSCIIRYGIQDESSLIKMPANPALKDVDITNIVNYILRDMNTQEKEYSLKEMEELLKKCETVTAEQ